MCPVKTTTKFHPFVRLFDTPPQSSLALNTGPPPHRPLPAMYLLRQTSTFVHVMWKMYLSCSANLIWYSHSAILLKFGANRSWNNWETWGPQPKERTMMVWKFTEGLGLAELVFRCLGRNDSKEHQAEANREGAMRMLAYYEEILKEKKECLSRKNSALCCSNLLHRHLFCWTLEMIVKTTSSQFEREGLLIKFLFAF